MVCGVCGRRWSATTSAQCDGCHRAKRRCLGQHARKAHFTQAWLAVSDDPLARSNREYFYHQQLRAPNPIARDVKVQDELVSECARISGITLPE